MKLYAATCTDGYKVGHGSMYADGTTKVYSNLTPRSDKIYRHNCTKFYDGKLVWVGAQGAVQEIMELWAEFFNSPKEQVVKRFARRMAGYLGGKVKATEQLAELHDLGFLPLEIKTLPEGLKVKPGIAVLTITNTLAPFFWLVNYLETVLSDLTWKMATNATIAAEYKAICKHYAEITGTDDFTVSIQCHDFSMRGMSGPEDAARAGFGHLCSFIGTDTLPALDYAEDYYDAPEDSLIGISVPATEHAVATSNILGVERKIKQRATREYISDERLEAERRFMRHLISQKFPTGIISYVADSFDFWAVLTQVLPSLKDVIMAREAEGLAPGKLVIRPDSGDPVEVVCGLGHVEQVDSLEKHEVIDAVECNDADVILHDGKYYVLDDIRRDGYEGWIESFKLREVSEAEVKGAVETLWEIFGGTTTDKGHKLLDSHIGLIYGDSITTKRAEEILRRLAEKGFASGNIVFGVGSYTYQCNTRDTFGFAVKATYTEVNGESIAIFKDPATDAKKKSAKGLLMVETDQEGELTLVDNVAWDLEQRGYLQTIFKDGQFVKRTTLDEIRKRLA